MIKNVSNEISNIVKQRIDEIITQGGKEVEHVLPEILRGAIEDVTKHHSECFEILGNNS